MSEKKFCLDLKKEDLEAWCKENSMPSYRAGQIYKWLSSGVTDTNKMTNLPADLRENSGKTLYLKR